MHAGPIRNKQCVKDYMHKEKRQCVLNVSFWINLFLTCTDFFFFTHTAGILATALRLAGLRIILSRVLTMSVKRGRTLRSFCQQSSISWCKALGQSMGGGKR